MTFKKGESGNTAGRPKDPVREVARLLKEFRDDLEAKRNVPPVPAAETALGFLKNVVDDLRQPLDQRIKAAHILAQYQAKKPSKMGKKETAAAVSRESSASGKPSRFAPMSAPPLKKAA